MGKKYKGYRGAGVLSSSCISIAAIILGGIFYEATLNGSPAYLKLWDNLIQNYLPLILDNDYSHIVANYPGFHWIVPEIVLSWCNKILGGPWIWPPPAPFHRDIGSPSCILGPLWRLWVYRPAKCNKTKSTAVDVLIKTPLQLRRPQGLKKNFLSKASATGQINLGGGGRVLNRGQLSYV